MQVHTFRLEVVQIGIFGRKKFKRNCYRNHTCALPSVMTPEQIQADVDTILKTMGLSDDDREELADPGAAPSPRATAASHPPAAVAPPPSSKLTSGSALSLKATEESVSAVSQSTED